MTDTKKYIEIFIGGSADKNISKEYNNLARQLGEEINDRDYLIWFDGCDGIIFFKGGIGTLAEVTKSIDTKKNHEHDKPIVILNINHECDELIDLLKHMI